jgi:spore maturation protein CgeB
MLCGMAEPRLQIPPGLRAHMRYDKFRGTTPRMLVLESHYWLDGACSRAAAEMGWAVEKAPVVMEGKLPRGHLDQLLRMILAFRPDFVLSVNLSGMDEQGLLAEILADWELPHVTWFVDNPRTILMNRRCYGSPYAMALTWEQAYTPYLQEAGFAAVHHLPLAADSALFAGNVCVEGCEAPAFLGNSMVDFAEREWEWLVQYPPLSEAVHDSFDRGIVTAEAFGEGLHTLLPPELLASLNPDQQRHAELYFFIEATRRKRFALMEALLPLGLRVHGDAGWSRLTAEALPGIPYEQAAGAFYRSRSINVNSTSVQMPNAVNQRVFDVPAAGGFLLTDTQPDLEQLFDASNELATYSDPAECAELVQRYLRDAAERLRIARAAQRRVLAEHTYKNRLRTIESLAKELWG